MNLEEWQSTLNQSSLPIVVEVWAPWCGPCRVMAPGLERVAQRYAGQVELVRVNADESPEVVQTLNILGIPTLIGFDRGKEVFRRMGLQSEAALGQLFDALTRGQTPHISLGLTERLLRLISGTVVLVLAWNNDASWILIAVGLGLIFSAVYDRCPLYNMLTTRVKSWLSLK